MNFKPLLAMMPLPSREKKGGKLKNQEQLSLENPSLHPSHLFAQGALFPIPPSLQTLVLWKTNTFPWSSALWLDMLGKLLVTIPGKEQELWKTGETRLGARKTQE